MNFIDKQEDDIGFEKLWKYIYLGSNKDSIQKIWGWLEW